MRWLAGRSLVWAGMVCSIVSSAIASETAGTQEPATEKPASPISAETNQEITARQAVKVGGISPLARELRALFLAQDGVASGHASAVKLQKSMLVQIAETLKAELQKPGNEQLAHSIMAYVLSGGNPQFADVLAAKESVGPRERRLLTFCSAYMRGEADKARKLLRFDDLSALPPQLQGRMALARSLLPEAEEFKAQDLLGLAIATLPGTLVEESALRRSALAFLEKQDGDHFWKRIDRYNRRFGRSLYARPFLGDIVNKLISAEKAGSTWDWQRLDGAILHLPQAVRRSVYLEVAAGAASANLRNLTRHAARRVLRLAVSGSTEEQQALLYLSIFPSTTEDWNSMSESLSRLRSSNLPPPQQALLAAAKQVATAVRQDTSLLDPADRESEVEELSDLSKRLDAELQLASELLVADSQ